jgi:hypothetical protein
MINVYAPDVQNVEGNPVKRASQRRACSMVLRL